MIDSLIRWFVTVLLVVVVGTVLGQVIVIVLAEAPDWTLVAVVMVAGIALFGFAVWCVGRPD